MDVGSSIVNHGAASPEKNPASRGTAGSAVKIKYDGNKQFSNYDLFQYHGTPWLE